MSSATDSDAVFTAACFTPAGDDPEAVRRATERFVLAFAALRREIGRVVVGQEAVVEEVLTALLADGHLLLEGVPGLGKTLLVPVDEPKSLTDDVIKPDSFHGDATSAAATPRLPSSSSSRAAASSARRREAAAAAVTTAGPGQYTVVKCGPSGHNIRSACSLKATAVGMLQYDAVIAATEDLVNADGVWVRLDDVSKDQYCHDQDGQSDNTCAFSCTFIWPVCAQMIVKSTIDRIVY